MLERLWILEPVPAWLPTAPLTRLAGPPKHQLADPALAARLLGITVDSLLAGSPAQPAIPRSQSLAGAFIESLVTLEVRVAAQAAGARVSHLRRTTLGSVRAAGGWLPIKNPVPPHERWQG